MNGIELLRNQSQRGCPLTVKNKALITASLDSEDEMAVKELGCAYIGKPFTLSDIKKWLNECEERIDLSSPIG
jgi:hypothetical protein